MNQLWTELAARAGLSMSVSQAEALNRYLDLLLAANARLNLTRITDRASCEILHIGDALTLLSLLPPGPHRLADVGTGGGVPGIPLAIMRPDAEVVLIEATRKKSRFLQSAIAELAVANVQVVEGRAEDIVQVPTPAPLLSAGSASRLPQVSTSINQCGYREVFDVVVVRAVARLVWLAEWCLPLAKRGGRVLAMKGENAQEELIEAKKTIEFLGGGEALVHPAELPGYDHRVILHIPKAQTTPSRYPRRATEAKGKPLSSRNR